MKSKLTLRPGQKPVNIYLLQEEILGMLRGIGMSIVSVGRGDKGPTAIHRFQVGSAKLQFGMLVALLNDYEKFSQSQGGIPSLSSRTVTVGEVEITRFDWTDVALAVDVLEANGEVEDRSVGDVDGLADREIWLTPKGLISYYTEVYQQRYEDKERAKALDDATIATGKATIVTGRATVRLYWATLVIAIGTLATPLLGYLNDNEKNELHKQVQEQGRTIQLLQQRQLPRGTLYSAPQKPPKDSAPPVFMSH